MSPSLFISSLHSGLETSGELTTKMETIGSKHPWRLVQTSRHSVAGWSRTGIQVPTDMCPTAQWPAASPLLLRRAASPWPCPGKRRNYMVGWRAPTQTLGWLAWAGRWLFFWLISFIGVICFLVGVQVQELPPVCGNRGYPLEHPAEL